MKKIVVRLILLPILVVVAVFAIANRQPVELSLWPLPWDAQAPLFLVLLASLLLGALIGGTLSWAGGHHHRSAARHNRRANERLQRQVDALKRNAHQPGATMPVVLPPASGSLGHPAPASELIEPRASQPPPSFTPLNRPR
jgi:uncharacterized integral membrane protein